MGITSIHSLKNQKIIVIVLWNNKSSSKDGYEYCGYFSRGTHPHTFLVSPPPSPGDNWWAHTDLWPLRTESLADRRAVYTWMSLRCSDTHSHWDSYEFPGHTHQYLKSAISVNQILSPATHPCMKFNLFYEYYDKNTHNNIHVCVFHFGSSVCNSFKKNRAMGDHSISVIYIYQFVIDSSEIQNFIWIGQRG